MKPTISIPLVLGMLACAACSHSSEDEEDCLNPSYKVPLQVTVNVDDSFQHHCVIDSVFDTRSEATPYLKYYVAAYPASSSSTLKTVIASSDTYTVPLSLHPGRYNMVSWVSYESATEQRSYNFYTDDFDELLLRNKYNYSGAHPYKLAWRGSEDKHIAYNSATVSLTASPAMALYRLEATDTAKYTPSKVVIKYTSDFPAAISAKDGNINWWWTDINFESSINDVLLASDYVFSQSSETYVTLTVEIYDENDRLRSCKKNLEVPLINGGITTVRGNFYSVLEGAAETSNGIKIKTEWDATFEIEI